MYIYIINTHTYVYIHVHIYMYISTSALCATQMHTLQSPPYATPHNFTTHTTLLHTPAHNFTTHTPAHNFTTHTHTQLTTHTPR